MAALVRRTTTYTRRWLKVRRGEVDRWLEEVRRLGIAEIEERDDIDPGTYEIAEEPVAVEEPIDYRAAYQAAATLEEKLNVIAHMLGLV